jgi:CheY-like chemotaxis protein
MTNILIIDDNDYLRKDIVRVVNTVFDEAKIIEASSYNEALEKIKSNRFEVVITDIKLNSVDYAQNEGLLIARQVKQNNNMTEVIVVTSYLSEESVLLSLKQCDANIKLLDRSQNHFLRNLTIQLSLINNQCIALLNPNKLWDQILDGKDKSSYWILFINGFDVKIDKEIAGEILIWHASIAKYESIFCAYQIPDNGFYDLCRYFNIDEFPSLIVSDDKYMKQFICIKPRALLKLMGCDEIKNNQKTIRQFLTKVHVQLRNGISLNSIKTKIKTKEYWDWIVWGANEFKDELIKIFT